MTYNHRTNVVIVPSAMGLLDSVTSHRQNYIPNLQLGPNFDKHFINY